MKRIVIKCIAAALSVLSISAAPIKAEALPHQIILTGNDNLIIYKNPVGAPVVHEQLLRELTMAPPNPILYLATDGGEIISGMEVVELIQRRGDVTIVTPRANSMGMAFLQAAKHRYVTGSLPILLAHQPQAVLRGQKSLPELLELIEQFLIPMEKRLNKLISSRLGMSEQEYREKTRTDWFIIGVDNIMAAKAADRHVEVICTPEAMKKTREQVEVVAGLFGPQVKKTKVLHCPIVDIPVESSTDIATP